MFNLIHPHEISKISHFRKKYVFGISFKRKIWEKLDKKGGCRRRDINDGVLINEKTNGKENKSSTSKTVGERNVFTKGIAWGI